jgi:O-antigen/teichoic acid export membrane protein
MHEKAQFREAACRMQPSLLKSGIAVTLLRGFNVVLGFAVLVLLTRILGPEGLGFYAYATTFLLLARIPVSNGFSPLLLRQAAGASVALAVSILLLTAGMAALAISPKLKTFEITLLIVVLLSATLFFDQLSALRMALLRGLGDHVAAQVPEMLVKPAIVILLLVGVLLVSGAQTFTSVLAYILAATAICYLAGAWLLKNKTPAALAAASPSIDKRSDLRTAALFASSATIAVLNATADILLLGVFRTASEVGQYKVALQVSVIGSIAYASLNMIAVQRFAVAHTQRKWSELQKTCTYLARLALLPAVFLFVVLLFGGRTIVPMAFGQAFSDSFKPMLILSAAQIFNCGSGMGKSLLMMTGHEDKVMKWTAIGLLANVTLCLLLIPIYGAEGAAASNALALILWNVGIWFTAWRLFGIDASAVTMVTPRSRSMQ